MSDAPTPDAPRHLPTPKRGAIPTPRSVIEKAKPYVPGAGPAEVDPAPKPAPATSADDKNKG